MLRKENGLKVLELLEVRELKNKWDHNPTPQFAQQCGMQPKFVE
jgi:hypothetical protein